MKFERDGWIFAQTPIWAACDPNISDGAHRLLTYLDWRQGNDDCCWPSISRMAGDLGVCGETIRRRLRELEEAGYLVTRRRVGRSNLYSLIADPDGASEKHTPTPRTGVGGNLTPGVGGGPTAGGGRPHKTVGGPPTESRVTSQTPVGHDDTKGREKGEREEDDEQAAGWPSVLKNLRLQMARSTFDQWLSDATARRDGETLVVQLTSEEALTWVSGRLDGIVRRTVERLFEGDLTVAYEVRPDA